MKYHSGDKYEGSWFYGVKEGYGELVLSDGTRYEGYFIKNKM